MQVFDSWAGILGTEQYAEFGLKYLNKIAASITEVPLTLFSKGAVASDVDIDHVVALSEAWKSGAHAWSSARRLAFANDISVSWALRAVTDNVNMSKGDRDPSSWIPPYRAAVCTYLVGWVAVKLRWGLSVDAAEKSSITSSWRSAGCSNRANPPTVDVRIAP